MLDKHEQEVRWYECVFELECVIIWYMTHYETITIARLLAIQLHYNGNANDIRLCADVDGD